jgi:glycosyltransferase involved in cell wall biosynthesis
MNSPKHVAYLSYDGLTDPLGQSQILPYTLGLSKQGYSITIISFEKKAALETSRDKMKELLAAHQITWIPLSYTKWPPVLSTVWDIWRLRQTIIKLNRINPIQLTHCRSYITALVGQQLKRKLNIRFLFDMRGFWADERVEGNIWNLNNLLYRIIYRYFKKKEKEFWSNADHIISLTENARQELMKHGVQVPITVIPTCVDLGHFDIKKIPLISRVNQRKRLGIGEDSFLLIYAGSWGTWYLTAEMLQFFESLRQQKSNTHFLILSPDAVNVPEQLQSYITHRKASREEMPALLACGDASVFFIKPSFSKKASSATKLGELVSMQLPVVTNAGWGDIQEFHGNGIMVIPDTSQQNLAMGAAWVASAKPAWPNALLEKLSLTHGVKQYQSVYISLLG